MLLLANKASERTSNDVVQYIKYFTKSKKCGHAGTLDPMATGLMILATDDDTKKLHDLTGKDKKYTATIDLGKISDTRDLEYREQFTQYEFDDSQIEIDWKKLARPTMEEIKTKLDSLTFSEWNPLPQLPLPPFSAKKIWWKKRYDLAREGSQEIVFQEMKIFDIQIVSYAAPLVQIECHVASGTYIRSIAYRLGKELGTGGILTQLERTQIGEYSLDDIWSYDPASKIPFSEVV